MIDPHSNKTVFIGDSGAGKSSLLYKIQTGEFYPHSPSTVGVAYTTYIHQFNGNEVKLHIWDTAGQDRFNTLLPLFVKGAKIVLICFDKQDIPLIQSYFIQTALCNPHCRIYLVATKMDLKICKVYPDIEEYAETQSLKVFYTSSVTGEGISELLDEMGRYVYFENPQINDCINISEVSPTQDSMCCHLL